MSKYQWDTSDEIENLGDGRGYNHKTGRYGWFDMHGVFHELPTAKEKRKLKEKQEERYQNTSGPDGYERFVNNLEDNISDTIRQTNREMVDGAKKFVAFGSLFLFMREIFKNPNSPGAAFSRTAFRLVGIAGFLMTGFISTILAAIITIFFSDTGFGNFISYVLVIISNIVGIGFIRMIFLKPFFPTITRGKRIKLPWYVYVGIEGASLFLLTKPVILWLDSFSASYVEMHKDTITYAEAMSWSMAIGIVGIAVAALCGIILCLLVRKLVKCVMRAS